MARELNVPGEAAVVPTGPCLRLLMPAMLALGHVESSEMPLAVAIELASIAGMARLARRIYQAALVRGGARLSWGSVLRLGPAVARCAPNRAPGRHVPPGVLPAAGRPGVRDLMDQWSWRRGCKRIVHAVCEVPGSGGGNVPTCCNTVASLDTLASWSSTSVSGSSWVRPGDLLQSSCPRLGSKMWSAARRLIWCVQNTAS